MRRFSKISGMTIVTCDHAPKQRYAGEPPTCAEEFRSASLPKVIPLQLKATGWTESADSKDGARRVRDFCPMHPLAPGFVMPDIREQRVLPDPPDWASIARPKPGP